MLILAAPGLYGPSTYHTARCSPGRRGRGEGSWDVHVLLLLVVVAEAGGCTCLLSWGIGWRG